MRRIPVYLALLVVVAACSFGEELRNPGDPVAMSPATLAGTWHGGTERFITFQEDGTFSAVNLPTPPFQDLLNSLGFDPTRHRLDGAGTWTLQGPPGGSTGPQATVHLTFSRLAGARVAYRGPDLSALRPGDGKVYLVFFYVAQGNSWTGYLKCEPGCVVPAPAAPVTSTASPPGPHAS